MQDIKLPLTAWFLAFHLNEQATSGISSLDLYRHLSVIDNTARLLHHKIRQAMTERNEVSVMGGKIQMDDANSGRERPGGKAGGGSENKMPIVAAISLNRAGHPIHAKLPPVLGFSSAALAWWANKHLGASSALHSDGAAGFLSVVQEDYSYAAIVTGEQHLSDRSDCRWTNIQLGNLKTSISGFLSTSKATLRSWRRKRKNTQWGLLLHTMPRSSIDDREAAWAI
ncbi:IS1595 family transposase [Synechococcus sp. BA-132 BA5]|uniref:IS1595 family transposase n=1 Tax=Synechococcus sp. BA-132 BA5 TaxID=3110252 RepID=UPI003FCE61CB